MNKSSESVASAFPGLILHIYAYIYIYIYICLRRLCWVITRGEYGAFVAGFPEYGPPPFFLFTSPLPWSPTA